MPQSNEQIKGYEVLSFEGVELTQVKGENKSFLDVGTLFVLYFQESVRFVLSLNDWTYCLLKRLSVTSSSRTNKQIRSYTFPGTEGFYILTLTKIPHFEALQNFETILSSSTNFSYQVEKEPNEWKSVSEKEERSEEERNLRKLSASERIKRGFAKIADKISRPFVKGSQDNVNLTHVKNIGALKKSIEFLSTHEFSKEEVSLSFSIILITLA